MSVTVASSRRLASQCLFCTFSSLSIQTPSRRRHLTSTPTLQADQGKPGDTPLKRANPILEEYRRKHPEQPAQSQGQTQQVPQAGDLGASSIFEDDRRAQIQAERDAAAEDEHRPVKAPAEPRDPRNMLRVLDPDPNSRERWERKKVIQTIRRGGRLTKLQFIKRTERAHLAKSHNMKTSVKKLGMLARQIAGKNIDDAITQMRFSKKKVAIEVRKQLEAARDEAVVMRGMGLANVQKEEDESAANDTSLAATDTITAEAEAKKHDHVDIQLKDGKRHRVVDRSKIYIDQAWVGRGPYGKLPDYRARGQVNVMRTPFTSLSLLLKEEATRVREYQEREAKRHRQRLQKVWVPMPDRPVTTQRQWYSW